MAVWNHNTGSRCMRGCGLGDSWVRGDGCKDHYCLLARGHVGPCDFIRPCGASLPTLVVVLLSPASVLAPAADVAPAPQLSAGVA